MTPGREQTDTAMIRSERRKRGAERHGLNGTKRRKLKPSKEESIRNEGSSSGSNDGSRDAMSNLDIRCRMTFVAVAFLLDLYSTPHLFGQASPIPGRDSVLNSVSEQLRTQFGTLRFHREEGFEDQFLPNVPSTTELELAPHFYKIEMPRFDHASGSALVHSGNGGLPTMYVGTSADERKVYRLYGFTDPEVEFNRLVGDIPFKKIGGTSDAETRGLLCAEIVYGLSDRWWVADPSNAKLQAAEHFLPWGTRMAFCLGNGGGGRSREP